MKKVAFGLIIGSLLLSLVALSTSAAGNGNSNSCTTIQDGELEYSAGHYLEGEPLQVGYDPFGYNYQAHMFSGYYCNVYLGGTGFPPYEGDADAYLAENPDAENHWAWPYRDVKLLMKWNDAWLSNKDCDDDGLLDRHYGFDNYIDSGAWETNHMWGSYEDDGKIYKWNYFVKIVAAPADAYVDEPYDNGNGTWYTADGIEIGPQIWGQFAIILQISNDPSLDEHGVLYKSPASPGFGFYKP